MYRFVFCPKEKNVEDAYALAEEWKLPIQHGDSERSQLHEFDRTNICVVSMPTDIGFDKDDVRPYVGEPVGIMYVDDWNESSKYSFFIRPYGIKTGKDNWNVPVMILDSHRVQIAISITFPGKYELVAKLDDIEKQSMIIEVMPLLEEEE